MTLGLSHTFCDGKLPHAAGQNAPYVAGAAPLRISRVACSLIISPPGAPLTLGAGALSLDADRIGGLDAIYPLY